MGAVKPPRKRPQLRKRMWPLRNSTIFASQKLGFEQSSRKAPHSFAPLSAANFSRGLYGTHTLSEVLYPMLWTVRGILAREVPCEHSGRRLSFTAFPGAFREDCLSPKNRAAILVEFRSGPIRLRSCGLFRSPCPPPVAVCPILDSTTPCRYYQRNASLSDEFTLIFCLKRGGPLISIRVLEIGALQEAVIDENF